MTEQNLHDQASTLKKVLKGLGFKVADSVARQVIAKLEACRNSAKPVPITGIANADIYEAIVTLDATMSATVRVHSRYPEQANELLLAAAHAQFPRGFEIDEGVNIEASSFYLGDECAVVEERASSLFVLTSSLLV